MQALHLALTASRKDARGSFAAVGAVFGVFIVLSLLGFCLWGVGAPTGRQDRSGLAGQSFPIPGLKSRESRTGLRRSAGSLSPKATSRDCSGAGAGTRLSFAKVGLGEP